MANLDFFPGKSRRRIVSFEECSHDLKDELILMFQAFYEAVTDYEAEIVLTPPQARARGFEASLLNSKMIFRIQQNFQDGWKFGKYKRFILRVNGYQILFKKLDNRGYPMNIVTKNVIAISQQLSFSLFDDTSNVVEPILFFGYRKDKFGNITNPQLVYIDENRIRWTFNESDLKIKISATLSDAASEESAMPKIRPEVKKWKRSVNN